ncbi:hypothetical protein BU15DRAFT_75864 [Melanogaster broomeanus]|nr:hypothetical protein BU15DRAFT_75864 [Melanogaster broomeanus]
MAAASFLKIDPAIERWNRMMCTSTSDSRRRTTLISLTGFVFVPGAIYYLASQTHLKYKWTGKRKGETLTEK